MAHTETSRSACDRAESPLCHARREYGLTLLEAATALGISPTRLEREENKRTPAIDLDAAHSRFEMFVASDKRAGAGRNLLFGVLPLRVARDILGLSIDAMAERYDASASHWKKIECHARELPRDTLRRVELDVRAGFARLCSDESEESQRPALFAGDDEF